MEVLMEKKIGARLAALRREMGLTQEKLADMLGISAPAVSKWETDSSYPDITLLCPLARALGTNVDTLLQFEDQLTDKEITDKITEIIETARQNGYETAETMLSALLHNYPSSVPLKFNAALTFDTFLFFFPDVDDLKKDAWIREKKKLLMDVRSSRAGSYWQTATLQLATIAIHENDLNLAEELLQELPELTTDPTIARSQLYLKKDEPEEALKIIQKRLYSLIRQVQFCLMSMMNPNVIPDMDRELEICRVYEKIDDLFGCGGMSDGMFLEIYLRQNKMEEAAECLTRYINRLTGSAILPKEFLFSPGLEPKEHQPASTKELRSMLLKALTEEDSYEELLQYPKCKEALQKLEYSLKE